VYYSLVLIAAAELAYACVHTLAPLPFLTILAVPLSVLLAATVASWLPPPRRAPPCRGDEHGQVQADRHAREALQLQLRPGPPRDFVCAKVDWPSRQRNR